MSENWVDAVFIPALKEALEQIGADEAMIYATAGGKRLRPRLVFDMARALRPDGWSAEAERALLACAVSLEMVHAYSLVHDDLPAMDNDLLRRGQPTVHAAFGEAEAILCGDALLTGAFATMARAMQETSGPMLRRLSQANRLLAEGAGQRGMIGGQMRDLSLASLDVEEARRMVEEKTAALFRVACAMSAKILAATPNEEEAADAFALHFGILFQLADDLDDIEQDEIQGKCTYARSLRDELVPTVQKELALALAGCQTLSNPLPLQAWLDRVTIE